ncbi:benzoate/H(+) symporter BenE family transporter [Aquabacterium sp. A7-Y]|uniref:benzoate/H(+) symporter BenE family transporter n=1 Tax=Aquabacterium sp. A7-Y TaxID=1349605 RepID=UPI00223D835D|nr:benzoate/H(+) symporter BenE family transporter [Aquabacterium sp. A7-Y]MCW7539570.1 benzoate/H(+) symporter BenE family transporter [Aquabacterium sp. A7-Y]
MRFFRDLSLSAVVAGFVAVLVGFTSSVALVFQAAAALGASPAVTTSWIWALGLGMGLTSILLSLHYRQPVLVAWSTPGAAVLATAGIGMPEAVGAFIVSAGLITLCGVTGLFARVMNRIPMPLAAALLAGVLARFGMEAFGALKSQFMLVLVMFLVYLLGRRLWPRYAVPSVLLAGVAVASALGQLHWSEVQWTLATPVWTTPEFSPGAVVGVALPLFVVTMASQNLPGVAAIRAAGYDTPVSPLVGGTGLVTLLLAPFGAYALNLAAITAAICLGREAHEDPTRRYTAAVMAGVFYVAVGVVGGAVVGLLAAFPRELVVAVAGFALLGTIGAGLATAVKDEPHRESALITFLVTLSGVSFWGIGSAFWGVVAGAIALAVQHYRIRAVQPDATVNPR